MTVRIDKYNPEHALLQAVAKARASKHENREALKWLQIEPDGNNRLAVATDGRRLHIATLEGATGIQPGQYEVISAKKSEIILDTVPDGPERPTYPDWRRVMPEATTQIATCPGTNGRYSQQGQYHSTTLANILRGMGGGYVLNYRFILDLDPDLIQDAPVYQNNEDGPVFLFGSAFRAVIMPLRPFGY